MPFRLPWGIDVAYSAVVFYGAGYLARNFLNNHRMSFSLAGILLILTLLSLNVAFSYLNGAVDMDANRLGNYFYFYIAAFLGIFSYILTAQIINKSKVLSYLGKNSLIILAFHLKVPAKFVMYKFLGLKLSVLGGALYGIIYTFISILLLLPVIYIINIHFYYLIGKGRKLLKEAANEQEMANFTHE